jgi:hypothetical protein
MSMVVQLCVQKLSPALLRWSKVVMPPSTVKYLASHQIAAERHNVFFSGDATRTVTVQERRREAERSGRMIDLTEHVSASVLAATAAKLEAEQNERDEAEAQKNVEEAVKPYKQKLVRPMSVTVSEV